MWARAGFDDERGDYLTVLHDHISYRYEVVGSLGKGSFGQVMKCFDYKDNTMKAIKIIRNKKRFHQQALVEVKILNHLKKHVKPARAFPLRFLPASYPFGASRTRDVKIAESDESWLARGDRKCGP